jgi:hypothetical protein
VSFECYFRHGVDDMLGFVTLLMIEALQMYKERAKIKNEDFVQILKDKKIIDFNILNEILASATLR